MIIAFVIFFLIIVFSFFCLSYQVFNLLVEIVKLKKLRQIVEKEKRLFKIKQRVKKSFLKKKVKRGRFSSILHKCKSS